jgi:hypothetical protein
MNSPFDNFIQEMLGNRNPQGNMLTGVSTTPNFYNQAQNNDYYDNRFRKQDSIDAAMAKKLADEQALAQQLGVGGGMMSGGGGSEMSLTADQIAYFDAETGMERDARMNNLFGGAAAPIAGLLGGPIGYGLAGLMSSSAPVYSGQDNYSTRSPAAIQQQVQAQAQAAAQRQAYAEAMNRASISYDSNAYGGGGGFTNSEGNAPGASYGEVGDSAFSGDVGYDQ